MKREPNYSFIGHFLHIFTDVLVIKYRVVCYGDGGLYGLELHIFTEAHFKHMDDSFCLLHPMLQLQRRSRNIYAHNNALTLAHAPRTDLQHSNRWTVKSK